MSAAAGAAATAIAGIASGLVGNILNFVGNERTNKMNQNINQTNLDYNKAMTEAAWNRDDNAHQREVADLEAAGLSPLAAMQGSSVSSPLGAPSPIAMQAPQIDMNGMLNAAIKSDELKETIRSHKANESAREKEINVSIKELELKQTQLDIQDKDVESQIRYRINVAKAEQARIDELVRHNKEEEKLRLSEQQLAQAKYESEKYYKEIKHQAGGDDVPYKTYTNYQDYLSARQVYLDALNAVIDDFIQHPQKSAASGSHGINLGAGAKGISGSIGGSNSESQYVDISPGFKAEWYKFQHKYPVPVYIGDN